MVFGLGGWELLLIAVVFLFFLGGRKIPELARSLGRSAGEFRRGREEVERELREAAKGESETVRAARKLGIPVEGKTEEELRREIATRVQDS